MLGMRSVVLFFIERSANSLFETTPSIFATFCGAHHLHRRESCSTKLQRPPKVGLVAMLDGTLYPS